MTLVRKSTVIGNRREALPPIVQQDQRLLHPHLTDIHREGAVKIMREIPAKMARVNSRMFCQFIQVEAFSVTVMDKFANTTHPFWTTAIRLFLAGHHSLEQMDQVAGDMEIQFLP